MKATYIFARGPMAVGLLCCSEYPRNFTKNS